MSDDNSYPDGIALSLDLSGDPDAVKELYSTDPVAFEILKRYAQDHDTTVEELAYGTEIASVEAPRLGYTELAAAANAQKKLHEQYESIMEGL